MKKLRRLRLRWPWYFKPHWHDGFVIMGDFVDMPAISKWNAVNHGECPSGYVGCTDCTNHPITDHHSDDPALD